MSSNKKSSAELAIPASEVEIMVKTYYAYSSLHPQFDPNTHVKSVWFPFDKIKQMVESLANEGGDGVRVYIGRYPLDVSDFIDPKPTPDTNTIVFVSTYLDGINHTDYFGNLPVHGVPFDPQNRGEQCQPHCGGTIPTP